MKTVIFAFCIFLLNTAAFAGDIQKPVKLDANGFNNILADAGKVYLAGQPSKEGIERLAAKGVTTIINFRTASEMSERVQYDEAALATSLGIDYVSIPLGNEAHPYNEAALAQFAAALKNARGKALVHCASAYRASHMWAAYLVKYEGMDINEAVAHGRAANLRTPPMETLLGGVTYSLAGDGEK